MANIVGQLYGFSYRGWVTFATLLLFLLFFLVLFKRVTETYQTPGEQMFRLQRAWNAETFKETLVDWSANNPRAPEIYKWDNLVKLDSFFPLIYSTCFAFAYAWARGTSRPVNGWDYLFFLVPFCAALFDYCENGFHLYLLHGINTRKQVASASFSDVLVHISTICSYIKLSLFSIGGVAYLVPLVKRVF